MRKILTLAIMTVMSLALVFSGNVFAEEADTTPPLITIGAADPKTVDEGGSVTYKVVTSDNSGIMAFNITRADIAMKGFTADIAIAKGINGNQKVITFSNIKSTNSSEKKYFVLAAGVSADGNFNVSTEMNSPAFTIKEKVVEEKDTTAPVLTIGAANPKEIYAGEKVVYKVAVNDNVGIASFEIKASDITMKGFTADVSIVKTGANTATVTFTNVKGTVGGSKHFVLAAGVAKDADGNTTMQMNSPAFTIKEKVEEPVEKPTQKPVEKPTQKPVKDVTPNTGREEGTVAPVVAVVSTLTLAGVVLAKKYTVSNCK